MNLRDNHKQEILGAIAKMKNDSVPLDKINSAVKLYVANKQGEYKAEETSNAEQLAVINNKKKEKNLEVEKVKEEEKTRLAALTPENDWDNGAPVTWAKKNEDDFISSFNKAYPNSGITVQATGSIGNRVNISGPGFRDNIDLDGSAASIAKLEVIKQRADEQEQAFIKDGPGFNLLVGADSFGQFGGFRDGERRFDDKDVQEANEGYKEIGIRIVPTSEKSIGKGYKIQRGSYDSNNKWVSSEDLTGNIGVAGVEDFFNNRENFTIEDKSKLMNKAQNYLKEQVNVRNRAQTDLGRKIDMSASKDAYTKTDQYGRDMQVAFQGMSEEDFKKVQAFVNNPIRDTEYNPEENWQSKRFDQMFSDEVRNSLSPEGQAIFDEAKNNDVFDRSMQRVNDAANEVVWNAEYSKRLSEDNNTVLVKYGARVDAQQEAKQLEEQYNTIEENTKIAGETYKKSMQNTFRFAKEIAQKAAEDGVRVETSQDSNGNNIYKAIGPKAAEYQAYLNQVRDQEQLHKQSYKQTVTTESDRLNLWMKENQDQDTKKIREIANRDSNTTRQMLDMFEDSVASFGDTFPILFGSDEAINRHKSRQAGSEKYEVALDYSTAVATGQKWKYTKQTGAQQGFNVLLAVGTAGAGSALTGSTVVASALTSTMFGLNSGTTKFADLTIQRNASIGAEEKLKELEENKDFMSYEDYINQKANLEETVAIGKMSDDEILAQATVSGVIEGGITMVAGTIPNANRLVKGFIKGPGDDILNAITQKNARYWASSGLEFAKRTGGEIAEELSIHFGDAASESLILGRDFDFEGWDDVVASSLIVGGGMNGPGIASTAIMNRVQTKEQRDAFNKSKAIIDKYKMDIATLPNTPDGEIMKEQLRTGIQEEYKKSVVLQNDMEVGGMLLGGDGTRDLLRNGIVLDNIYNDAGVIPGDSQVIIDNKLTEHSDSLKGRDKKEFDNRLKTARDQKEKIMGKIDYKNGHKVWGTRGEAVHKNLLKNNPAYKDMTDRQKAVEVHRVVKGDLKNQIIAEAKADPGLVGMVEASLGPKKKYKQKKRQADQEARYDKEYERLGKLFGGFKAEGVSRFKSENVNASDFLSDKRLESLKVVEAVDGNFEQELRDMEQNGELRKGESANDLIAELKSGETFGMIVGNKYIVTDQAAAAKNLADGKLTQGTVLSHEIKHAVDNLAFNDTELVNYSTNLANWASENAGPVHAEAISRIIGNAEYTKFDPMKPWNEQDIMVHAEYGNYIQDAIQRDQNGPYKKKLYSNKAGFMSIFNSDYDINSPQNAAAYLADHMKGFDSGKMGRLTKKRIDSANRKRVEDNSGNLVRKSSDLQGILDREYKGNKTPKSEMAGFVDTMLKTDFNGKPMVEGGQQLSAFNFQVGGIVESITKRLYDPILRDNKKILSREDYVTTLLNDAGVLIAKEYRPADQNLDKFLSSRLNLRANSLAKKLGVTQTFTTDIDQANNVFTEDDVEFDENNNVVEEGTPFVDNLQLTPAETEVVLDHVKLNLGSILPAVDAKRGKNAVVSPLVAKLKKEFYKEKNPIQQTIEAAMGKTPAEVEMWLKDPKNKASILKHMPTTWLAKNMPKAVQKLVIQEDGTKVWTTDHVGRTKGTKPGQVDFYRSTEVGPYKGMTDGKQKIRRNPKAMTDITSVDLIKKFFNGTTMTELRRGGLNTLTQAMSQEIGLEMFRNEMQNDGPIAQMFKSRQELLHGEIADSITSKIVDQVERGMVLKSNEGKNVSAASFMQGVDDVSINRVVGVALRYGADSKQAAEAMEMIDGSQDVVNHVLNELKKKGITKDNIGYIQRVTGNNNSPYVIKEALRNGVHQLSGKIEGKRTIKKENADRYVEGLIEFNKAFPLDASLMKAMGGLDTLGFHNRMLDAALDKRDAFGKKTGVKAPYYDKSQDVKNGFVNENLDYVSDMMFMNKGNSKLVTMYSPILHEKNTTQEALAHLETIRPKLNAANRANILGMKNIVFKLNEAYQNGKLSPENLVTIFQLQTSAAKGFRGSSKVEYFMNGNFIDNSKFKMPKEGDVDGLKKLSEYDYYESRMAINRKKTDSEYAAQQKTYKDLIIKGEHLGANSDTMAELTLAISTNTLTEARFNEIVENHTQFFGPKFLMDEILDIELGKNSKEGHKRITLAIDKTTDLTSAEKKQMLESIYHISGERADINIANRELGIETFKPREALKSSENMGQAAANRYLNTEPKGISVLDFDDTLATSKSLVKYTKPDGEVGTLTPEQYAAEYENLADLGYEFDFSEFNKVVQGKIAPLFNKALKLADKFGTNDIFILTARPPAAQKAIHKFLKDNGLNLPIENITGLGNSTAEAKALWVADKAAQGYNDFYFADDALKNVQAVKNMLDQFDVKSKVRQATLKSNDMGASLNSMIARTLGIAEYKEYSQAKAQLAGKTKGKYKFYIAPGAEDFKGLLYPLLGKGKQGDADMKFMKDNLLDPFSRGIEQMNMMAQNLSTDFAALNKAMPKAKKKLNKKIGDSLFNHDNAVRVYLWDKAGVEIPGLSKADKKLMLKAVQGDSMLMQYAEGLAKVTKSPSYIDPEGGWLTSTIARDLYGMTQGQGRKQALAEFIQNREAMFGEWQGGRLNGPLMNKLEASLGTNWREAMEDIMWRMENGSNRSFGKNKLTNRFANWVNNSVGAIMFFNGRSAVLQTLSTVNYINWNDNNVAKAAAAFANQPQFWKDFAYIFNSDMLKQRRSGNQRSVSESELAQVAATSSNPAGAVLQKLLDLGFLPTQMADSFAIAAGGAPMYRNRVKTYMKQGMSKADAEAKAFTDFQKITEESQQSSRPDMISSQQASPLGRLILAFQNTPMQYARLTKKAILDLKNGRGDAKTNISKIIYYGAAQNLIFGALQTAMFKFMFDDEEDEEKLAQDKKNKTLRLTNGMVDSFLRGTGVAGAIVATLKNMLMRFIQEDQKGFNFSESAIMIEMLNVSPPIGSKVRKVRTGLQTYKYKKKEIDHMDKMDFDNPMWSSVSQGISALTNVPTDRVYQKIQNLKSASDADNDTWQRIALSLGWNQWDIGVKNKAVEQAKVEIQEKKEAEKEAKKEAKRKEKERLRKEQEAREVRCSAKTRKGKGPRCKNKTENKSGKCYAHQ